MKDTIKFLLELLKLSKKLVSIYRKEKNARKKKKIRKAVAKRDIDALRHLILNK